MRTRLDTGPVHIPFHFLLSGQSICPSSANLGVQGGCGTGGDRWPTPRWGGRSALCRGPQAPPPLSWRRQCACASGLWRQRGPGRVDRHVPADTQRLIWVGGAGPLGLVGGSPPHGRCGGNGPSPRPPTWPWGMEGGRSGASGQPAVGSTPRLSQQPRCPLSAGRDPGGTQTALLSPQESLHQRPAEANSDQ